MEIKGKVGRGVKASPVKRSMPSGWLALAFIGMLPLFAATQGSGPGSVAGLSRNAAESAATKMRQIQEASLAGRSFGVVRIGEVEANSYLQYELAADFPPGVSKARLQLQPERPQASAEVDFDKLKAASRNPPNPLVDYFVQGVHTIGVEGTLAGAGGTAEFHLETVTLDGITMPRFVVDYLIDHYVKTHYPGVAIDRPFQMGFSIDKLKIEAGSIVLIGFPASSSR